jgi:hypothetical protein
MRKTVVAFCLFLAVVPAFALKPCEELKSEIAAKLDAKGVKNYQLEIVAAGDVKGQTVVGSCEAGAKKITYAKGDAKVGQVGQADKPATPPKGH